MHFYFCEFHYFVSPYFSFKGLLNKDCRRILVICLSGSLYSYVCQME